MLSAGCCALRQRVLLIFISAAAVYGLGFVSMAVLIGRPKGLTGGAGRWRSPRFPLAPLPGPAPALTFAAADWAHAASGRPNLLTLGALLGAALLCYRFALRKHPGGWARQLALEHSAADSPRTAGGQRDD